MNALSPSQKADAPVGRPGDVLLGEDWDTPEAMAEASHAGAGRLRGLRMLERSPLARKIILFNLLALVVFVSGVLFFNPFRDGLAAQQQRALTAEARLVATLIESRLAGGAPEGLAELGPGLAKLEVSAGAEAFVLDTAGAELGRITGAPADLPTGTGRTTYITDFLDLIWSSVSGIFGERAATGPSPGAEGLAGLSATALARGEVTAADIVVAEGRRHAVAAPIRKEGVIVGAVVLTASHDLIDRQVGYEREQVLQMFVIAILVSVGLSVVLASTIANPLADLAAAAELGQNRGSRHMTPGRIRIPDLTARPDEIGRLSVAMRGMVAALYDRIESNEQFAADVAHEIKNPLASLRSAVGSLRMVKKEEHREKLLDVIEHDVRRLDRLVSDISNASRLDSELVKEDEEPFNLLRTLENLCQYLGDQAREKGVEFITDFPADPIVVTGLEARLAQVFVNLVTNAISFCEDGDAVRVWVRKRDNRVLVVVEDTGPGIPDGALKKIFKRFYSDRPPTHFGNNSGLGLSISKQIVEAHGGVIWAENIRPTQADITSEPLGARFVVGLPV